MVLEKRAFYEYILQLKMGYVILKLVFLIILQNKDMVKIKTVVIILKILAKFRSINIFIMSKYCLFNFVNLFVIVTFLNKSLVSLV